MRIKINKTVAMNAAPGSSDITIVDIAIAGFALRIRPSGAKTWIYRYRNSQGLQRRLVLGKFPGVTVEQARELATKAAGDVANGNDVMAEKRAKREVAIRQSKNTLRSFIQDKYEPWATTNLRSGKFQVSRIKIDFADWLDKPLSELNKWLIESWRKRRIEIGNQHSTINRNLQRLHAVLSRAVEWEVIEQHPFSGMKSLTSDQSGRVRYLSAAEEGRLRDAMTAAETQRREARDRFNEWKIARHQKSLRKHTGEFVDHLRPMVLLAMNTGLRRGELFNLRWKHVDLHSKWLTVAGATAKSGQTRRIPLNVEALMLLTNWHTQSKEKGAERFVFPGSDGNKLTDIHKAWGSLTERAEVEDFRFHDLRHHFASRLVQGGVDLNRVRELMGHADIEMVLRYAHMAPDCLVDAVEKIARLPEEIAPLRHSQGKNTPCSNERAA